MLPLDYYLIHGSQPSLVVNLNDWVKLWKDTEHSNYQTLNSSFFNRFKKNSSQKMSITTPKATNISSELLRENWHNSHRLSPYNGMLQKVFKKRDIMKRKIKKLNKKGKSHNHTHLDGMKATELIANTGIIVGGFCCCFLLFIFGTVYVKLIAWQISRHVLLHHLWYY